MLILIRMDVITKAQTNFGRLPGSCVTDFSRSIGSTGYCACYFGPGKFSAGDFVSEGEFSLGLRLWLLILRG
jgi:hypothetical protein